MLGRGWDRVDAKFVDQRCLGESQMAATDGRPRYELWQYMVEVTGEDGTPVRLTIKEKSFKLKLPAVGGSVPVLVNSKRTKAKFDFSDKTIDGVAALKAGTRAAKDRDAARFQEELTEPGGSASLRAREAAARAESEALDAIRQGDDLRALEAMEAAERASDEAQRENAD